MGASVSASRAEATGVTSGANTSVSTSGADASSVRAGRTKTAGVAGRADASSTVVSIGVDTRVNHVSDTTMRSVGAGGVIVARHIAANVCAGVASAAETRCAGVGAGMGAGGAKTSGVSRGADTSCADTSAGCAVSASGASGGAVSDVSCCVFVVTERKEAYLARPSRSESMRGSAALAARLE